MVRTISEIYAEYKIMPNLQEHMLRVAAVASLICDNFDKSLPKREIITACLLHDMGNIIKFKLDYFPELNEPEGMEYWKNVQNKYIEKYGRDENVAHKKIALEVGVSRHIVELIGSISFLGAPSNALNEDFGKKIVEYCDDRVNPFGVVGLEERLMDLRKRYSRHSNHTSERDAFENAVMQMEKQIFAKCKIKPEDINDDAIAPIISDLKNFVIK